LVAVEQCLRIRLVQESLLASGLIVGILAEPNTIEVVLIASKRCQEESAGEAQTRIFLAVLNGGVQRTVLPITVIKVKDRLRGLRRLPEVQIGADGANEGSRRRQLIINDWLRGRLVKQDRELVTGAELIDHLKLSERLPFVRCRHIEPDEVVIARLIQAVNLVENDAEHSEGVQLLVNILQLLANDRHSVLHAEEAISHDVETVRLHDRPRLNDLVLATEAVVVGSDLVHRHTH